MPEITEGQLTFHFPTEWQAISYDAPGSFYHTKVQRSPLDFKAVDILACSPDTCIFIEIKDCAGNEAENRPRFAGQDPAELVETKNWIKQQGWDSLVKAKRAKPYLPDEVAQKVVDTLTGLVASMRQADTTLANFQPGLYAQKLDIVLFLTLNHEPTTYKLLAYRLAQAIRARLHFLKINEVIVCNEQSIPSSAAWSVTRNVAST